MDVQEILEGLTNDDGLPVEAIRAAEADRAAMVPAFLEAIENYLSGDEVARDKPSPIFFIFHLLGSWREKSAYRPLARLLALPRDEIGPVIGGAITESTHRVMAAVFDGDPQPLYDVILNENADEFVRSRMLEALAMVTLRGEVGREEIAEFLRLCFPKLQAEPGCFVWNGWQSAVAFLGLEETTPLVKEAFEKKWIDPSWLGFEDFLEDLTLAVEQPGAPRSVGPADEYTVFGDTIEELSTWYCFSPKYEEDKRRAAEAKTRKEPLWDATQGRAINPFKNVGRNDPCPCGSGKKFKKCCLDAYREAPFRGEAA
ncbi:MAG TPA: DUF1186 domain-containing protein [Xanthobacteraceae bacterium]|nr:DUF1186 domain-containing protein [Xanthobacteraceae bacterium]